MSSFESDMVIIIGVYAVMFIAYRAGFRAGCKSATTAASIQEKGLMAGLDAAHKAHEPKKAAGEGGE